MMVSTGNPVSCPRCLTSAHRARRTCAPSPLSAFLQDHGITVCPACDPRQHAIKFNQPLSWDTSGVTDMKRMFFVRCCPRPARQSPVTPTLARCMHRDLVPRTPARGTRLAHRPLHPARLPCDSSGRNLPVGRQQVAHPLRVGGHPRLHLRWLWPRRYSEMALGSLCLKPSPRCACGRGRVYGGCPCTTARNVCVASTPTPK